MPNSEPTPAPGPAPDLELIEHGAQLGAQLVAECVHPVVHIRCQAVHDNLSSGHCDRVRVEGTRVGYRRAFRRVEQLHDVGPASERTDRSAAADYLSERSHVRYHAERLLGAARRDSKALHLIVDEDDAELGGEIAESLQERDVAGGDIQSWTSRAP